MKLKALLGKEKKHYNLPYPISSAKRIIVDKAVDGYNTARKEDSEIEIELDVYKTIEVLSEIIPHFKFFEFNEKKCEAQALADNLDKIIKRSG